MRHLLTWTLALALGCSTSPTATSDLADATAGADVDTGGGGADADDVATADVPAYDVSIAPVVLPTAPTAYVDPRIGTGGSGNVFFGVAAPHAMLKVGPDTDNGGGDIKGYQYDATRIQGFSHTHLDGPGGSAYGYSQIALLPTMGTPTFDENKYAATFTHADEIAQPDYYAVTLTDHQIRAELTGVAHCAWHRYTFPAGTARVLVSLGHTRGQSTGGHAAIDADGHLSGRGDYNVHPMLGGLLEEKTPPTGLVSVYTDIAFVQPPLRTGLFRDKAAIAGKTGDGADLGAWVEWDLPEPATRDVHVCISLISAERAATYRATELAGQTMQSLRAQVDSQWNDLLQRIAVSTTDHDALTRFYTALYHATLQPADYTEAGDFWNGSKAKAAVQQTGLRRFYTDDWCVWDTARTVHPLLTLIEQERVGDMLQSMLWLTGEDGYLNKCSWQASGDSRVMTGNFTFCLFADALTKGLHDFDTAEALKVMTHGALTDSVNPGDAGLCGYLNQGSPPFYVEHGWVPGECDVTQGASMTLEHAYSDWCLGQYAQAMGETAFAGQMHARGANWKNTWGPHNYPQLRNADGSWSEPFDPAGPTGFTEATAWIYQWLVPHDRCGLVAQLGGKAAAQARLDEFFTVGHFDMGNEPDFHAPWFYHDLGRPDLSADRVRSLMAQHFRIVPDGLPGNDDAGAMSAWLVFASIGLYPVAPGDTQYALTPPLYPHVALRVGDHVVRIETTGPLDTGHIVAASWNDQPLKTPWISHNQLATGGVLNLTVATGPSPWGTTGCP